MPFGGFFTINSGKNRVKGFFRGRGSLPRRVLYYRLAPVPEIRDQSSEDWFPATSSQLVRPLSSEVRAIVDAETIV